jgi:glycosyltransferase involved in cell wall biosynthesis
MPSEFLETFGLSALNALSRGIPVIGYKKGWLEPFILPECNLFSYKGKNTAEKLLHCIEKLHDKGTQPNNHRDTSLTRTKLQDIVAQYTQEIWYQHFLSLCWNKVPKKIVLVSDFTNKVGGIETYLYDVKSLLEERGHIVDLWGGYLPKGSWGRIRIYIGLLFAPINFWSARKFRRFLKKEKPDLIRFHSLLRNLWPNVVRIAKQHTKNSIRMMYHDFGYFYPYPKKLFFIDEVKTPLNFQHFMMGAKGEWRIKKLATLCKYIRIQGLVKTLKKSVHLHLVPSPFMENIVSESYQIPEKKVKSFPHFIQK